MQKKGCLGCSFPVLIVLIVFFLGLFILGFLAGPIGHSLFPSLKLPPWLSVSQPEPRLPTEAIFHIFGFAITNTIFTTWITIIVLGLIFWGATRKSRLVPRRLQALAEYVLEFLLSFCQGIAGEKNGRRFFPLVSTIFLMVITNAWLSLLPVFGSIVIHTPEGGIPFLRGANTDANLPLAMALISFVFVAYHGLRMRGMSYVKEYLNFEPFFHAVKLIFTGKPKEGMSGLLTGAIAVFVGVLELLGRFITILSFTFRLFGNMTAGEILILIFIFLIPFLMVLPIYFLEMLVGLVQALIFAGLTLVFATMAISSHEAEHH